MMQNRNRWLAAACAAACAGAALACPTAAEQTAYSLDELMAMSLEELETEAGYPGIAAHLANLEAMPPAYLQSGAVRYYILLKDESAVIPTLWETVTWEQEDGTHSTERVSNARVAALLGLPEAILYADIETARPGDYTTWVLDYFEVEQAELLKLQIDLTAYGKENQAKTYYLADSILRQAECVQNTAIDVWVSAPCTNPLAYTLVDPLLAEYPAFEALRQEDHLQIFNDHGVFGNLGNAVSYGTYMQETASPDEAACIYLFQAVNQNDVHISLALKDDPDIDNSPSNELTPLAKERIAQAEEIISIYISQKPGASYEFRKELYDHPTFGAYIPVSNAQSAQAMVNELAAAGLIWKAGYSSFQGFTQNRYFSRVFDLVYNGTNDGNDPVADAAAIEANLAEMGYRFTVTPEESDEGRILRMETDTPYTMDEACALVEMISKRFSYTSNLLPAPTIAYPTFADEAAYPLYYADSSAGDLDLNGAVNVADAVLLARLSAEDTTLRLAEQSCGNADLDGDGLAAANDLVTLLLQLAKKLPFPPTYG